MLDFKGSQFEREIILWGVRWYVAYPISYRQLEEMMGERGVTVDHSTLNRWVIKYAPEIEKRFRRRQHPVGRNSLRLDSPCYFLAKPRLLTVCIASHGDLSGAALSPPVGIHRTLRPNGLPPACTGHGVFHSFHLCASWRTGHYYPRGRMRSVILLSP
jgi:hypothetical protein